MGHPACVCPLTAPGTADPTTRDGHPLAGKAAPAQFAQVDVGPLQISLYPRAEVRTNSKRPSAPASLSRLHERNSNISLP